MAERMVRKEGSGPVLPVGTVTFLLADIEGSTRLWENDPEAMTAAVARLDQVIANVIAAHDGHRPVEQGEGDSFVIVFTRASDASAAAIHLQEAELSPIRLRIGIHTGEAQLRDQANYVGPAVNRTARLRDTAHGGQTVLSQATRDLVVDQLPKGASVVDLGTHRLRDLARPEQVFQLCPSAGPVEFPPLRSLDAFPHNLPVQLTSFVGRVGDLRELRGLLRDTRLLTLTGTGGAGKTRLALQLAADALMEFADGVWVADLAPVTSPDLAATVAAHAVGIRNEGSSVTDGMVRHLRPKRVLLVLDNCEHVVTACAELAQTLLESCPTLTILATSREPIGISGETTWRVPSLPVGDPEASTAGTPEAVQLFVERAARALPTFALTAANGPAVMDICRRLDGIPLAIELAAARVRAFPPAQIATGLDDRFRLLTGGARTASPRQQTLRGSVEWSHDLLTAPERTLFRRLAVFAGSFDYPAAERVSAGDGLERYHVLDQLALLVDKSLVVAEDHGGHARYRLLETVRQLAEEHLELVGESDDVRRRHRDHYLELAGSATRYVLGPAQDQTLDALELDLDNLRAAFAWSMRSGETEAAAMLAVSLNGLWWMRGYYGEGQKWLHSVLRESDTLSPPIRAMALALAATIAGQAPGESGPDLANEALAIARAANNPGLLIFALRSAATASFLSDIGQALSLFDQAVDLARQAGDTTNLAAALQTLAVTRMLAGDPVGAASAGEEAIDLARQAQIPYLTRWARVALGRAQLSLGEIDAAKSLLLDVAAEAAVGDRVATTTAQAFAAEATARIGDIGAARELARASVAVSDQIGSPFHRAIAQYGSGIVELIAGDPAAAVDSFGHAWTMVDGAPGMGDAVLGPWAEAELARGNLEAARLLSEDALTRARAGGFQLHEGAAARVAARVATADGDLERAEELARLGLVASNAVGDALGTADALELLASITHNREGPETEIRLLGAADAIRHQVGAIRPAIHRGRHDACVDALRTLAGDDAFHRAFEAGAALSVESAVAYAQRGHGQRRRPASGWSSLTPAERDVAMLVGEGLTNKAIAAKLFISPRTVQAHLTHMFAKLGISSRVELAREVTQRELGG
jgi:predicted ATPase/class 3 adenylate cyclase/DNA-binding CsgD family transcriptional regulator